MKWVTPIYNHHRRNSPSLVVCLKLHRGRPLGPSDPWKPRVKQSQPFTFTPVYCQYSSTFDSFATCLQTTADTLKNMGGNQSICGKPTVLGRMWDTKVQDQTEIPAAVRTKSVWGKLRYQAFHQLQEQWQQVHLLLLLATSILPPSQRQTWLRNISPALHWSWNSPINIIVELPSSQGLQWFKREAH